MKKKIAIVNQRYGLEVNGGSELYTRQIAEKLIAHYDVEVLTTCALEYTTWANYYKAGISNINGVPVRRFAVKHPRNAKRFSAINQRLLTEDYDNLETENQWVDAQGPYCPELIEYIKSHQNHYDVFIFVTYLYYLTVRGIEMVKDKAILIPTAHDEPYIKFQIYRKVFGSPKSMVFLTHEEKEFVHNTFNNRQIPYDVLGAGIDVPENVNFNKFKNKYLLDDYIVYVGRIDEGKNCLELFSHFLKYKERNPSNLKLVLIGKSVIEIPSSKDIISLGFVSDNEKFAGISGAKLLVLPSLYESLSISVLEAMALGVPVLVNGKCEVLKGHCVRSNAGLYYQNFMEFEGALSYIINNLDVYSTMKLNARQYIKRTYSWNDIIKGYQKLIEQL